jgi:CMP-N-acetylneuraminic acid synthetase
MTFIALIPARGGSKGVPRKNLRCVGGQSLVSLAVTSALASRRLGRVIVSTDDPEIADIAQKAGAEVPFLRPARLAQDETPTVAVARHAVEWLESRGTPLDALVILQPTSPLRRAAHIDAAIERFITTGADSVVTVCEAEHNPFWMQRLEGDRLVPLLPSGMAAQRRQDLPPVYRLNGAVYVVRRRLLMDDALIMGPDTRAVVMAQTDSIDIDSDLDLQLAELELKRSSADHGGGQ